MNIGDNYDLYKNLLNIKGFLNDKKNIVFKKMLEIKNSTKNILDIQKHIIEKLIVEDKVKKILFLSFEIEEDPIVIYENGKLLYFNKAYKDIIGYTFDEIKKDPINILYGWSEQEKEKVKNDVENALKTGKGYSYNTYVLKSKSGQLFSIAWKNLIINGYQIRTGSISLATKLRIMADNKSSFENLMTEFMKRIDEYTSLHIKRVMELSYIIGKSYGYNEEELEKLKMMALCHDLGKSKIDPRILRKPYGLTHLERNIINNHVYEGIKLGLNFGENIYGIPHHADFYNKNGSKDLIFEELVDQIRRFIQIDGLNFNKLVGKNIPEQARIISVADSADAMATRRLYSSLRDKKIENILSHLKSELTNCSGLVFSNQKIKLDSNKWISTTNEDEKKLPYCILFEGEYYIPEPSIDRIQFDPNIIKTIFKNGELIEELDYTIRKNDEYIIDFIINEIEKHINDLEMGNYETKKIEDFKQSMKKLKELQK